MTFVDLGVQKVKNIEEPVRAYQVGTPSEAREAPPRVLEAESQPPLPDKPSIAVLPFQNMSGDPEQEYFADGMVEEITTALSRCESARGPDADRHVKPLIQFAVEGSLSGAYSHGTRPKSARNRPELNLVISENAGRGERLDLLCGHFAIAPPHDRLLRSYLPPRLVVHARGQDGGESATQLAGLVTLLRGESADDRLGGHAMLNALSTAMFALVLRLASETEDAPRGLLALAGHPRLAPAVAAMFNEPARAWSLPDLARLCNMSRATLARQFQEKLGRSASDLLADIRMTLAANELRNSSLSTGAVAEAVGYQSEAAFQRAFKSHMGATPAQWRKMGSVSTLMVRPLIEASIRSR